MKQEEERLGRLYIKGDISEEAYKKLHAEWWENIQNAKVNLENFSKEIFVQIDDLDLALALMVRMKDLYPRLKNEDKTELLKILAKKIIVNSDSEIVGQELNSPFMYLLSIAARMQKLRFTESESGLFPHSISELETLTLPLDL